MEDSKLNKNSQDWEFLENRHQLNKLNTKIEFLENKVIKLEQQIVGGASYRQHEKLGTVDLMWDAKIAALDEAIEAICTPYKEYLKTGENK